MGRGGAKDSQARTSTCSESGFVKQKDRNDCYHIKSDSDKKRNATLKTSSGKHVEDSEPT